MTKFIINNRTDAWQTDVNLLSIYRSILAPFKKAEPGEVLSPLRQFSLQTQPTKRADQKDK